MKLLISALTKFICGVLAVGLLVFLPAGTFSYPGALLLCGLLFVPMLILGIVLYMKAPELLKKRLASKEKEKTQKGVVAFSGLAFILSFVLSGLDFRFGWSNLPMTVNYVGAGLFLTAYVLYAEVLRENRWLSRTIEVQEGQTVVSTGLYSIVRHPMYFATVILFLSMPLVLGSIPAFLVFLCYPAIIARRIRNEEQVLSRDLPGYREYCGRVRWRLIPFIW